jgi:hypothetical protein
MSSKTIYEYEKMSNQDHGIQVPKVNDLVMVILRKDGRR